MRVPVAQNIANAANPDYVRRSLQLEEFVASLTSPRAIILMVPAGPIVDKQIDVLDPSVNPKSCENRHFC